MKYLPKITVVIPSFNKAKYIGQTFESIFSQNYENLEVIVKDGGSADGTVEIVKKYAKKYSFYWESKKDGGQLDAINKGLLKATGDIVTFINADDVYEKGSFKQISDLYAKNPGALWFAGQGIIVDGKNNEVARFWTFCKNILLQINSYFFLLLTSNYIMQPSVFVTKAAYKKYGPFTGVGKYVFEYELWLKLGRESMPIIIPRVLSKFRTGGANMSSEFLSSIFAKDMEIIKKYSNSPIFIITHWLNNNIRLLVNKFV